MAGDLYQIRPLEGVSAVPPNGTSTTICRARSRLIYRDTSLELQPIAKGTTIWIYYGWPSVRPLIVLP